MEILEKRVRPQLVHLMLALLFPERYLADFSVEVVSDVFQGKVHTPSAGFECKNSPDLVSVSRKLCSGIASYMMRYQKNFLKACTPFH